MHHHELTWPQTQVGDLAEASSLVINKGNNNKRKNGYDNR